MPWALDRPASAGRSSTASSPPILKPSELLHATAMFRSSAATTRTRSGTSSSTGRTARLRSGAGTASRARPNSFSRRARSWTATTWRPWSRSPSPRGDGLVVHGYMTFPPGQGRRNLPAVLNVHGGPQVRDVWGFNSEAQWIANRGYLCVQVNYRGSSGYGKRSSHAERPRVGRQDAGRPDRRGRSTSSPQGWSPTRSRVAIYGGSYGGYAALVGAAFTPDVFCCAVDIVGPSNLKTLLETIPPYWAPAAAALYRRVGHPVDDEDVPGGPARHRRSMPTTSAILAADRAGRERPQGSSRPSPEQIVDC